MNVLLLYLEFVKIGLFSIGGGLATLPFVYRLAASADWLDAGQIPDMLAVAQIVPGAIGVNLTAYLGVRAAGVAGAAAAALGLVSGPIAVILIIARLYAAFQRNAVVRSVFDGLRPAAAGLLAAVCYGLLRLSLWDAGAGARHGSIRMREALLFAAFYVLMTRLPRLSTVLFIAAGALVGIALKL